jgi:O-antigen ligase
MNFTKTHETIGNFNSTTLSRWMGLMCAFGIPWSNGFFNFGFYLMMIFFTLSIRNYSHWKETFKTPAVIVALSLFTFILIKTCFSIAPWKIGAYDLIHYRKLLVIPVFLILFTSIEQKKSLITSYCLGIIVLMLPTLIDGFGFGKLIDHLSFFRKNAAYMISQNGAPNLVYWRNQIVHGFHVSILFSAALMASFYYKKYRYLLLVLSALCAADLLFFIYGRMALISLFFSLSVIALLHLRSKKHVAIMLATILVATSSTYFIIPSVKVRISSITNETSAYINKSDIRTSAGERLNYWAVSLKMFKEYPITGMGSGSFKKQLEVTKDPFFSNGRAHTHNEYLTQLSQYGLIGFVLFVSLLIITLRNSRKIKDKWLANLTTTGTAIFALNCLTDSSLHNDWEGWGFVVIASIASQQIKTKKSLTQKCIS